MGKKRKALLAKAVGKAPTWLKTIQIAKGGHRRKVPGTFGPASAVKIIKPEEERS